MAYTILSGDPRAVGTPNPPVDTNNINDVVTGMGGVYNVLNTAYAGGADPTGVADSTAAFQAAITAATAINGIVFAPLGTYKITSGPLTYTAPFRFFGASAGGVTLTTTANGLFTNAHNNVVTGCEFSYFTADVTGGDVFHNINDAQMLIHHATLIQRSATHSILATQAPSCSLIQCTFGPSLYTNVYGDATTGLRSVPAWSLSSSIGGGVADVVFDRVQFTNLGGSAANNFDNTQYQVLLDATGTNAQTMGCSFRDCYWEHPFGGCVQSLSGEALVIDGCVVWDIVPGQSYSGNSQTLGNSLYYFGKDSGSSKPSQGVRVVGCSRSRTGPNGSTTWDIECESTSNQILVEQYTIDSTPSFENDIYFNFHGCTDVTMISNQSPTTANSSSTTVVTNPSPNMVAIQDGGVAVTAGTAPMAYAVRQTSDTSARLNIDDAGTLHWGSGTAATDMFIQRVGTPGLQVGGGQFQVTRSGAGNNCYAAQVNADANQRWIVDTNGKMTWGPGTASTDLDLYRNAAGELKTDNSFTVVKNLTVGGAALAAGGLGVFGLVNAGTAPSTTPSGGGVLYGAGGLPDYIGSDGKSRNLAQPPGWLPEDSGYLEWNFDPSVAVGTQTPLPTNGGVYLIRVNIRVARSVTNVIVYLGTLGGNLTSGENFAGLYDSSGNLIGSSADQTAIWNTGGSTGLKTIALSGGPFAVSAGFADVALMSNWTSTGPAPSFGRAQNFNATISNPGLSVTGARWATSASSGTTSLPSPTTPSSNSYAQVSYFAGLS